MRWKGSECFAALIGTFSHAVVCTPLFNIRLGKGSASLSCDLRYVRLPFTLCKHSLNLTSSLLHNTSLPHMKWLEGAVLSDNLAFFVFFFFSGGG